MSPYITKERRAQLDDSPEPETMGELTYTLCKEVDAYITRRGKDFQALGESMGALEASKQELYRRVVGPYEDQKMLANGDVWEVG